MARPAHPRSAARFVRARPAGIEGFIVGFVEPLKGLATKFCDRFAFGVRISERVGLGGRGGGLWGAGQHGARERRRGRRDSEPRYLSTWAASRTQWALG